MTSPEASLISAEASLVSAEASLVPAEASLTAGTSSEAAPAAEAAAHHLVGDRADLLSVHRDCSAGEACSPVIVKAGIAVDADRSSGDDDIAVGVDAVGVSRSHCDGNRTAGDFHSRRVRGGFARRVDAVVRGRDRDVAAADKDIRALDPFICRDVQRAAGDFHLLIRMDAVVPAPDRELTGTDEDRAVGVDRVVKGVDLPDATVDRDRTARFDALEGFRGVAALRAASSSGSNADVGVLLFPRPFRFPSGCRRCPP